MTHDTDHMTQDHMTQDHMTQNTDHMTQDHMTQNTGSHDTDHMTQDHMTQNTDHMTHDTGSHDTGSHDIGLTGWSVDEVLEVLALHLFLHREVQRSQPMATVTACHLDTDVSIATGTHSVQDTAQQSIPVDVRGPERPQELTVDVCTCI